MKKKINSKPVGQYASTFEQKVRKSMKKKGVRTVYEPHSIQYTIHGDYTPDFIVYLPSGHSFYVEAKGWFKYEDMRKMDAVISQHPELDIRMVFMAKNKKNIRWCEKRNIKWAVGTVPKEWLSDV